MFPYWLAWHTPFPPPRTSSRRGTHLQTCQVALCLHGPVSGCPQLLPGGDLRGCCGHCHSQACQMGSAPDETPDPDQGEELAEREGGCCDSLTPGSAPEESSHDCRCCVSAVQSWQAPERGLQRKRAAGSVAAGRRSLCHECSCALSPPLRSLCQHSASPQAGVSLAAGNGTSRTSRSSHSRQGSRDGGSFQRPHTPCSGFACQPGRAS